MLPRDPMILVSFINTQLRDFYSDLEDLCESLQVDKEALKKDLSKVDYHYDKTTNQFRR